MDGWFHPWGLLLDGQSALLGMTGKQPGDYQLTSTDLTVAFTRGTDWMVLSPEHVLTTAGSP